MTPVMGLSPAWIVALVSAIGIGVVGQFWRTGLRRAFGQRCSEARVQPLPAAPVLTEEHLAHLPTPVARYVRLSGSIGRSMVTEIVMHFAATMYDAPDKAGMRGKVLQYERFDIPRRLFFMATWMKGLPVAVLHDFNHNEATMCVRLAGLANVVNAGGAELTRTETVTLLNDLAFYAPSRLVDPSLRWTVVDESRAQVTFVLGVNSVSAELVFDALGNLVDFHSHDRGMLQPDGSLLVLPWSTPLGRYRDFGGWRVASEGEAIWHRSDGPFAYGHFRLTHYEAR